MSATVRVLHLTRDLPPRAKGGVSTAVGGMTRAQARAGVDVAVVSFDGWRPKRRRDLGQPPPRPAREGDLAVLRVCAPAELPAAHAFADAFAPDVIHAHHGMLWEIAETLCDRLGAPGVIHIHVLQSALNALRGVTERTLSLAGQERALAAAHRIVAPSEVVARALRQGDPTLTPRLRVAGLGIDDSPAARAAASAPMARRGGPIAYVGRFDDVKGIDELFAAVDALAGALPTARFEIAGGVPDNRRADRRWRRRWQERASEDAQARTALLGWLDAEALSGLYARAALLLAPSRYETFGLVVLEAMLHGVPIAATRAGAVPEVLTHGATGLTSAVGDVDALVANARALWQDEDLAARLGAAAADEARARWSWDARAPALLDIYSELQG
ncbi:MAG: hypothetical protein CSA66_08035 [Proteobacteria bacterium]|nr:MAG: hypothetical protein CSA66_08035 [Pseudomonadota bacterium]